MFFYVSGSILTSLLLLGLIGIDTSLQDDQEYTKATMLLHSHWQLRWTQWYGRLWSRLSIHESHEDHECTVSIKEQCHVSWEEHFGSTSICTDTLKFITVIQTHSLYTLIMNNGIAAEFCFSKMLSMLIFHCLYSMHEQSFKRVCMPIYYHILYKMIIRSSYLSFLFL